MDFARHPRRTNLNKEDIELSSHYPHDLQLYDNIPTSTILIHDFEEIALERLKGMNVIFMLCESLIIIVLLKVLKIIETVTLRGFVKFSEEWRKNFQEELKKQDLKTLAKLVRLKLTLMFFRINLNHNFSTQALE